MVQSIEHFGSQLDLETLADLDRFNEPKIEVPITRCGEDVSTITVLTGCRNAERRIQIHAARQCRRGGKNYGPKSGLPGQITQLGADRSLDNCSRCLRRVGSAASRRAGAVATG